MNERVASLSSLLGVQESDSAQSNPRTKRVRFAPDLEGEFDEDAVESKMASLFRIYLEGIGAAPFSPDDFECILCCKPNANIVEIACSHIFHAACLAACWEGSKGCPLCRRDIEFMRGYLSDPLIERIAAEVFGATLSSSVILDPADPSFFAVETLKDFGKTVDKPLLTFDSNGSCSVSIEGRSDVMIDFARSRNSFQLSTVLALNPFDTIPLNVLENLLSINPAHPKVFRPYFSLIDCGDGENLLILTCSLKVPSSDHLKELPRNYLLQKVQMFSHFVSELSSNLNKQSFITQIAQGDYRNFLPDRQVEDGLSSEHLAGIRDWGMEALTEFHRVVPGMKVEGQEGDFWHAVRSKGDLFIKIDLREGLGFCLDLIEGKVIFHQEIIQEIPLDLDAESKEAFFESILEKVHPKDSRTTFFYLNKRPDHFSLVFSQEYAFTELMKLCELGEEERRFMLLRSFILFNKEAEAEAGRF